MQRGIFVAGLREEIVNSADQVLKLIEMGEGLSFSSTFYVTSVDWYILLLNSNLKKVTYKQLTAQRRSSHALDIHTIPRLEEN